MPYRRITSALPFEGERAFVTYVDPDPDDFYDYWMQAVETADYRHLHLGGLMPPEYMLPLFKRARERGATISMDCQDAPQLCLSVRLGGTAGGGRYFHARMPAKPA